MPRKTRKQKIRAQEAWAVKREFTFDPESIKHKNFEPKLAKNIDKSGNLSFDVLYMPDLVRTIVLALIILSLELVLYWARA